MKPAAPFRRGAWALLSLLWWLSLLPVAADAPDWWKKPGVFSSSRPPEDNAVASMGQAMHLVQRARQSLNDSPVVTHAGGVGAEINGLLNAYNPQWNPRALRLGQLKHLAAPFWKRLQALSSPGIPPSPAHPYPWTAATHDDQDQALATVGQVKMAFSFHVPSGKYADDFDGDGLTDQQEATLGTNPLLRDTDGDGMEDGWEHHYAFAPLSSASTNPQSSGTADDPDGDGVININEFKNGVSPTAGLDVDLAPFNGLLELSWFGVEGFYYELEYTFTFAPGDWHPMPWSEFEWDAAPWDGMGDNSPVSLFIQDFFDPMPPDAYFRLKSQSPLDSDGDSLPDWRELALGTDPENPDSDGDGWSDGFEYKTGSNPLLSSVIPDLDGDPDGDGLSNYWEKRLGTNPLSANVTDYDGDGLANHEDAHPGESAVNWPKSPESRYFVFPLISDSHPWYPGSVHPDSISLNNLNHVVASFYDEDDFYSIIHWNGTAWRKLNSYIREEFSALLFSGYDGNLNPVYDRMPVNIFADGYRLFLNDNGTVASSTNAFFDDDAHIFGALFGPNIIWPGFDGIPDDNPLIVGKNPSWDEDMEDYDMQTVWDGLGLVYALGPNDEIYANVRSEFSSEEGLARFLKSQPNEQGDVIIENEFFNSAKIASISTDGTLLANVSNNNHFYKNIYELDGVVAMAHPVADGLPSFSGVERLPDSSGNPGMGRIAVVDESIEDGQSFVHFLEQDFSIVKKANIASVVQGGQLREVNINGVFIGRKNNTFPIPPTPIVWRNGKTEFLNALLADPQWAIKEAYHLNNNDVILAEVTSVPPGAPPADHLAFLVPVELDSKDRGIIGSIEASALGDIQIRFENATHSKDYGTYTIPAMGTASPDALIYTNEDAIFSEAEFDNKRAGTLDPRSSKAVTFWREGAKLRFATVSDDLGEFKITVRKNGVDIGAITHTLTQDKQFAGLIYALEGLIAGDPAPEIKAYRGSLGQFIPQPFYASTYAPSGVADPRPTPNSTLISTLYAAAPSAVLAAFPNQSTLSAKDVFGQFILKFSLEADATASDLLLIQLARYYGLPYTELNTILWQLASPAIRQQYGTVGALANTTTFRQFIGSLWSVGSSSLNTALAEALAATHPVLVADPGEADQADADFLNGNLPSQLRNRNWLTRTLIPWLMNKMAMGAVCGQGIVYGVWDGVASDAQGIAEGVQQILRLPQTLYNIFKDPYECACEVYQTFKQLQELTWNDVRTMANHMWESFLQQQHDRIAWDFLGLDPADPNVLRTFMAGYLTGYIGEQVGIAFLTAGGALAVQVSAKLANLGIKAGRYISGFIKVARQGTNIVQHVFEGAGTLNDTAKGARQVTHQFTQFTSNAQQSRAVKRASEFCDSPKGCFATGTQVLLADGATKAIDTIFPGDMVLADNPEDDQPPVPQVVTARWRSQSNAWHTIGWDTDGDGVSDGNVKATHEHPFWVVGRGWLPASALRLGDRLKTAAATLVTICSLSASSATEPCWNLQVEGHHTYFVQQGGTAVLVHNAQWDVYDYGQGPLTPGNQQHHQWWHAWLKRKFPNAIDGDVAYPDYRIKGFPIVEVSPATHTIINNAADEWLTNRFGPGVVRGNAPWGDLSIDEMKELADFTAQRANMPNSVRKQINSNMAVWLVKKLKIGGCP